jgi:hypothetical protein
MTITENEKKLLWQILYSVRNCFNDDGTLVRDYCDAVILPDLTEEQKKTFDGLVNEKLLR